MDYVKKRTHVINHPKFLEAGPFGRDLYDWGMLYAGQHETDGELALIAVTTTPWGKGGKANIKVADDLVRLELWEKTETGYRVLKWSEQGNVTRAQIEEAREAARERMAKARGRSRSPRSSDEVPDDVRANNRRTSPVVPTSTSTSTSYSSDQDSEEREGLAAAPAPAPPRGVPGPSDPPPDWFAGAVATVSQTTGEEIHVGEAWLAYAGHRHGKTIRPTREDAMYWLTRVMVPDAREARRRAAERRDAPKGRFEAPPVQRATPEQERAFGEGLAKRIAARRQREASGT